MLRPKQDIRARIDALTTTDGPHLMWTGAMRRGRPYMKAPIGNPVRVLLNVTHPEIQVRSVCLHERCIEPTHWRVIVERNRKYDDKPRPIWRDPRDNNLAQFTDREAQEIEEAVQMLLDEEATVDDLAFYPAHVRDEIVKRATAVPT